MQLATVTVVPVGPSIAMPPAEGLNPEALSEIVQLRIEALPDATQMAPPSWVALFQSNRQSLIAREFVVLWALT
jgi:hypothetical protein